MIVTVIVGAGIVVPEGFLKGCIVLGIVINPGERIDGPFLEPSLLFRSIIAGILTAVAVAGIVNGFVPSTSPSSFSSGSVDRGIVAPVAGIVLLFGTSSVASIHVVLYCFFIEVSDVRTAIDPKKAYKSNRSTEQKMCTHDPVIDR